MIRRTKRPLDSNALRAVRGGAVLIVEPDAFESSKTDKRKQSLYFPE